MYPFNPTTYDIAEQGTSDEHLDYAYATQNVLDRHLASANTVPATQGGSQVDPSLLRSSFPIGQDEAGSLYDAFLTPREQETHHRSPNKSQSELLAPVLQMLSEVLGQKTDGKANGSVHEQASEQNGGGADDGGDAQVKYLRQKVDRLTSRVDAMESRLQQLFMLTGKIDSLSQSLDDIRSTVEKQNQRMNTISTGVDDASGRFRHLLSRLSRPRDHDDEAALYDSYS